jgi:type II secretory pathway pseudopilin PulG
VIAINSTLKRRDDEGFGMAEILVSVALLLVVAVSMLPVIISSLQASATNVSITTATQTVSEQMDLARDLSPTCLAIQGFANEATGLYVYDPRHVVILEVHRSAPATCPGTYPTAFALTAWVTEKGKTEVLAKAETRIYITGETVP